MPVNNIFVVVSQSRDEGMEVHSFHTESGARKFISAEVEETKTNLINGGYKPYITFREAGYYTNLTAVNETIWYEWRIFRTKIS